MAADPSLPPHILDVVYSQTPESVVASLSLDELADARRWMLAFGAFASRRSAAAFVAGDPCFYGRDRVVPPTVSGRGVLRPQA